MRPRPRLNLSQTLTALETLCAREMPAYEPINNQHILLAQSATPPVRLWQDELKAVSQPVEAVAHEGKKWRI